MTYFSQLEARQASLPNIKRTHTHTHKNVQVHVHTRAHTTTHHLLLWIYSHERPKNLLLRLLGTIRGGISYACLCVRTCVCVCVGMHICVCVLALEYVT